MKYTKDDIVTFYQWMANSNKLSEKERKHAAEILSTATPEHFEMFSILADESGMFGGVVSPPLEVFFGFLVKIGTWKRKWRARKSKGNK